MQSRGPHPRSGWRPSEPATVLLAAPGLAENAAEVAGNPALVRAANGGRQRRACAPRGCRAHRGPQRCSWPVARCRDREQCRMPSSRQYTCSAHLCACVAVYLPKLLYCGAASPCSFPSRLDTNGVRCELESFTRSPDPSFSSSARELAATRRTFGAQKRAITASHRLSPLPQPPSSPISHRAAELSTRHGQRKHHRVAVHGQRQQ